MNSSVMLLNDGFENIPKILLAHGFKKVLSVQIEPVKREFNNHYEVFVRDNDYKLVHITCVITRDIYKEINLEDLQGKRFDELRTFVEKIFLGKNINAATLSKVIKI